MLSTVLSSQAPAANCRDCSRCPHWATAAGRDTGSTELVATINTLSSQCRTREVEGECENFGYFASIHRYSFTSWSHGQAQLRTLMPPSTALPYNKLILSYPFPHLTKPQNRHRTKFEHEQLRRSLCTQFRVNTALHFKSNTANPAAGWQRSLAGGQYNTQ